MFDFIADPGTSDLAKAYAKWLIRVPTDFPPAFGGERMAFGVALFSQLLATMTSMAAIIQIVRLYRAYHRRWTEPAQMHRLALIGLFVSIIMLAAPNAYYNLAWKEVPDATMYLAQRVRIFCQGAFILPFLYGMSHLTVAQFVIGAQMEREPIPYKLMATRLQIAQSLGLGLCCAVLALGVALAK